MIDTVRTTYTALRIKPPPSGRELSVLPIGHSAGAYAAIDQEARQHLLLVSREDSQLPGDVPALGIGNRVLVVGGVKTQFVDVTCLFDSLSEVFDHFVSAILEHMEQSGDGAAETVSIVLATWRQFLVTGRNPPSRSRLAALVGELLVVLDAVQATGRPDIAFWAGPFGGRHDLRSASTAIEVKTTLAHTSHRVTVHGEDQLLPPDGGELYLHFVRLEAVPGSGHSVASLVDALIAAGVAAAEIYAALTNAGVPVEHLTDAAKATFEVRERFTLLVDSAIPRIIPESFTDNVRPIGVMDITYVSELNQCVELAVTADAYKALLNRMRRQEEV